MVDGTCSIPQCSKPAQSRGWCQMHYYRWYRWGDPLVVFQIRGDTPARFWSKVDKSGDCWLWTGAKNNSGYGTLVIEGIGRVAHRVAWEWANGPVPEGLELDHLCRVPACVRVTHLEPVTHRVNMLRSPITPSTINLGKTHCPKGHPYDEANTRIGRKGGRFCRTCKRESTRRSRLHYHGTTQCFRRTCLA